ncbi:hypothetical protein J2S13_001939 [Oikeobacillus pervagus]|uniref:Uncharacterized protein n=1 Tax=Oikeobacillus pervagus TaxID=1325931 RepID=A0AAJ1WKV0_9BACI|nr:hypothetical protein [Oikeobacillus pervagus]
MTGAGYFGPFSLRRKYADEQGASAFEPIQLQRLSASEFLRFLPPISQHQLVDDLAVFPLSQS